MPAIARTETRVEIPRDRFQRPLVVPPGGGPPVAYRRCTTFIDVLADRFNLELWKQRQVAVGLTKRPDLVLKASSAPEDKKVLNEVCQAALDAAGSSAKATIGTAIHALTERLDRGEEMGEVPAAWKADLEAYGKAKEEFVVQDVEVFVVNDDLQVGGTFDRVVHLKGVPHIRFVADLKTGDITYDTAKIAMQLAVYANSMRYDPVTHERTPLEVDRELGLVIHLPAGEGTCKLLWANLKAGWEGVQLAAEVWAWRKRKGLVK